MGWYYFGVESWLFISCRSRIWSASVPEHWSCVISWNSSRAGGQALNLSCEISCLVINEFKALYQDWGLENQCLSMANFCWIVIFSLYLKVLFVLQVMLGLAETLFAKVLCLKGAVRYEDLGRKKPNPNLCIFVWEVTQGRLSVELGQWRAEWKYLSLPLEAPGWCSWQHTAYNCLKQFPGTWLLLAFSVWSRLKNLDKKSPLIIMDKMIVSNDYPRCSFHQLVLFAAWKGSQVAQK